MKQQFKSAEIESAINQLLQAKNSVVSTSVLASFLGGAPNDKELPRHPRP